MVKKREKRSLILTQSRGRHHHEDGSFEFTQPHLIQRIFKDLGLEWVQQAKSRTTPSERAILSKDSNGSPRKYESKWNYLLRLECLLLQGNTMPDIISVATHQCTRFSMDPKRSHEVAVMRIGRYLRLSVDKEGKGIIYKPDKKLGLECYVIPTFNKRGRTKMRKDGARCDLPKIKK